MMNIFSVIRSLLPRLGGIGMFSFCCGVGAMAQEPVVGSVPAGLGIPTHYTKYAGARGVHIVSTDRVPDSCFVRTHRIVTSMLDAVRPEAVEAMKARGARVVLMERYEGITDMPEYRYLLDDMSGGHWDLRTRTSAATDDLPVTLGAEENLLAYQIDPFFPEDSFIGSFAQSIMTLGVSAIDESAMAELEGIYRKAMAKGLWKDTYAAGSAMLYFGEGMKSWYDAQAESPMPDGCHNWVNTREDLQRYDPELYAFIAKHFAVPTEHISKHAKVNVYKKDDAKAWAKMHKEKKLNIAIPEARIEAVSADLRKTLRLGDFYQKYVNSNGIHILSSEKVPDECLRQAHQTIYAMTSMLPKDVLDAMTRVNTRVVVMGRYEATVQVPEHSNLRHDRKMNWNLRARGLGGTLHEPITSCAEENILAYPVDKYHAEDILIHEFSHSIHLIGILQVDPSINDILTELLNKAKAAGKWVNTYAETDIAEYWAEGVQNWFNVNAEVEFAKGDGKHNRVNTREELKKNDPALYKLIAKYFPATNAQIGKHKKVNLFKL